MIITTNTLFPKQKAGKETQLPPAVEFLGALDQCSTSIIKNVGLALGHFPVMERLEQKNKLKHKKKTLVF